MNTKHTDSVDPWDTFIDELEPFNVPPQVMNRLCSHFRNTLQATHSQQVDEAVKAETERCRRIVEDYSGRMLELQDQAIGASHEDSRIMLVYDLQSRLVAIEHISQALTPNHQD